MPRCSSLSSIMSPPPFVPHLLSSNMNPRERLFERALTCDGWRSNPGRRPTGVTGLLCDLATPHTSPCPNSISSSLNVSPVKPQHGCCHCINRLRKHSPRVRAPRAQRGLPGGKAFVGEGESPRWTKNESNPRRALTIRLLNGPVTIHNRF